ncbi:hypothetical protein CLV90_3440 [Maribacter spongiicola]|uniref:PH (Pleckstrin Homology) domain-containing protein n=1 Tax=Maribacter spongiicola TaxID=1206753 RepID=A0A4R7JQV3_9FLAO|nr:hypothetical protein [Maribacter spongiicola]TDT40591.1 hypothetical protein CLV90_3440 [Maribacter spongiicola]
MKEGVQFKETQKFTQWWLWLIILAPIIIAAFNLISSILYVFGGYSSSDSGNVSMSWISGRISMFQFIFIVTYIITILFLALSKLKVVVSDSEIKIRHILFFNKVIDLSEVKEQHIIDYDFVGYGIRKTKMYGTVYNVKGKEGVAFTLKNGDKYLIGSQKAEQFLKSLSK